MGQGKLSDDEFESQEAQNKDFAAQVEVLRKVIADELSFGEATITLWISIFNDIEINLLFVL